MNHNHEKCFSPENVNVYYKNQKSHLTSGGKWTDEIFPPTYESIMSLDKKGNFIDNYVEQIDIDDMNKLKIEWKRINEIFPNGFKVFDKIEFDDIKQGSLGNCYFLSAIAAMAEFPCLINHIIRYSKSNDKNYYEVVMFIDGIWQIVVIDDYFPVIKGTKNFAFTRTNGNEIWVLILEKAWAKVNLGYLNIVGGISSDPFSALTSFPSVNYRHDEINIDELWDKILTSDQCNDIMCTSTDGDTSKQKAVGLVEGHAYTIISAKSAIHDGKKIRLLRIRNPWGDTEWKGDWSDSSRLWNDELRAKFDYKNINDGAFWMSVEDFVKYFDATIICNVLYDEKAKHFKIENKDLSKPLVYNMFLKEKARVSFSVFRKHWRYHRELRELNHPISIVVAAYDNDSYSFNKVEGSFSSNDSVETVEYLDPGHYAIWIYHAMDGSDSPALDNLIFRITSKSDFNAKFKGYDPEYKFVREMILAGCRLIYAKEINKEGMFMEIEHGFKKTGIGYIFSSNTSNRKVNYIIDMSGIVNYIPIPNQNINNKLTIGVNPGGVMIVLGMRKVSIGSYGFCVGAEYGTKSKDGVGNKVLSDIRELLSDLSKESIDYDHIFEVTHKDDETGHSHSHDNPNQEISKKPSNIKQEASVNLNDDKNDILTMSLRKEFPELMDKILSLPKVVNDEDLGWRNAKISKDYYVGQLNKDNKIEGRGAYVITGGYTHISQWLNSKKNGFGKLYDKNNNLIFQGNFQNDLYNGFGKLNFDNGDRYEGLFKDNVLSGKGIYYFNNGDFWDGYFNEGRLHGKGIYTNKDGRKSEIEFINNREVDINDTRRKTVSLNYYSNSVGEDTSTMKTVKIQKNSLKIKS